jgi:broad-specificity NMP kinase
MHLLLITGFLGSGKTTLCLGLARAAQAARRRCALLVNEIGEIGIDNQLMRHLDLNVFSDQSYLRVSVVAANLPVTVEGHVPAGCTGLELPLNVLVYGLERTALERMTRET